MDRNGIRGSRLRTALLVALGIALLAAGVTLAVVRARMTRPEPHVTEPEPRPPTPVRQPLYRLKHGYKNAGVSFSHGDEYVASAGELGFDVNGRKELGVVRLWYLGPQAADRLAGAPAEPRPRVMLFDRAGDYSSGKSVAFSPNGEWLAAGGEPGLHVWRTDGAREEQTRFFSPGPEASGRRRPGGYYVSFGRDGKTLALGRATSPIRLIDVETGKETGELDPGRDNFVASGFSAFAPTGELLAAAGPRGVFVWNLRKRQVVATLPHQDVSSLAFAPQGGTLVTLNNTEAKFWDTAGWKEKGSRPAKGASGTLSGGCSQLAFDPSGFRLALPGADGNIEILGGASNAVADGVSRETRYDSVVDRLPDGAQDIAFSRSGRMLATCRSDLIEVWQPRE